jgi:hypothetical protein
LALRVQVREAQTLTRLHKPIYNRSAGDAKFEPIGRAVDKRPEPDREPLIVSGRFAAPRHRPDRGQRRQDPRPSHVARRR